MLHKFDRLLDLSPREFAQRLRWRFQQPATVQLERILASSKLRPQRLWDMLSRYEAILRRQTSWPDLIFQNQRVLELGSGPLLGWAPLALFCGAESYDCIDPNPFLLTFELPDLREKFLRPLHKDLSALFGPLMSFKELLERLNGDVRLIARPLAEATSSHQYDIVLSNSCLEHIIPLEPSIRRLAKFCSPETRHLHLVDFGSHTLAKNPFHGLYDVSRQTASTKFVKQLNLLRLPDMTTIFEDSGIPIQATPYYSWAEQFDRHVHTDWSARYSAEDLFTKTAILATWPQ